MQGVGGGGAEREFRRVGATDDDGTCGFQILDQRRVVGSDDAGIGLDAIWRGATFLVDVFLDGDRYTVQWPDGAGTG
jgi:hypothetical protein